MKTTDIPEPNFKSSRIVFQDELIILMMLLILEYNYKSEDAIAVDRITNEIKNDFVRSGNALLFNFDFLSKD
jgi:hypothetical protein